MSAPLSVEGGRTTASVHEQEQLGKTAKSLPAVANQPQEPRLQQSGSVAPSACLHVDAHVARGGRFCPDCRAFDREYTP